MFFSSSFMASCLRFFDTISCSFVQLLSWKITLHLRVPTPFSCIPPQSHEITRWRGLIFHNHLSMIWFHFTILLLKDFVKSCGRETCKEQEERSRSHDFLADYTSSALPWQNSLMLLHHRHSELMPLLQTVSTSSTLFVLLLSTKPCQQTMFTLLSCQPFNFSTCILQWVMHE